ncbi:MAG: flagellar motor switch protein FliG [Rhodobacteraceae bacterium]|nr:flagellar motor switch protein FliG [Paracoccaceae bacterium]
MSALAPLPPLGDLPKIGSGGGGGGSTGHLSGRQKAAIIVRLLVAHGAKLPISELPEDLQTSLTEEIGQMKPIDRDTLHAVVDEFADRIESIGLSFPGSIAGALDLLDGHLSAPAASRLRRLAGNSGKADPWERIASVEADRLLPILEEESIEIGAVMLSKLSVSKAAELLGRLPGDKARRIAYAVSQTGAIDPDTVRRIGLSLSQQLEAVPPKAFDTGPVERVGAILNYSPANTREEVLKGLEETDRSFADEVRKAIFTFTNIPVRIDARDVPKIIRNVDQAVLVAALAGAKGDDTKSAEFILANISQRMADSLREEMQALGKVKDKDAEEAQGQVIAAIREMEAEGEIFLVAEEDADE